MDCKKNTSLALFLALNLVFFSLSSACVNCPVPKRVLGGHKYPSPPGTPGGPTTPGSPGTPGGPSTPGTPGGPTTPGGPGTPGGPSTPGTPGTPGGPTTPGTPGGPTTPGTPGGPSTPGTPGGPTTPGTPGGPTTPGTPGGPSTPGTPGTPGNGTGTCPRDALQLGVCALLLGGLLNITIGTPPVTPCCSLIQGLVDLEAALCLCTAIRANILGINLNIPLSLSLLLNVCSRNAPPNFQCP